MEVIVNIFNHKVGVLYEKNGVISFEYEQGFLDSGLNLSPLKLPFSRETYSNTDDKYFGTLAGVFFDSLPDKFGTKVMERYYESKNMAVKDLTLLQKLIYIGNTGMGALEYEPSEKFSNDSMSVEPIEIRELYESTKKIVKGETTQSIKEMLALMDSAIQAGGARPKSTIGWNRDKNIITNSKNTDADYEQWLVKFDSVDENAIPTDFTKLEYVYMDMAKDCDINIPLTDMIKDNGLSHFAIKRFDRNGLNRIHMHSLASIVHVNFNEPLHYSYDEAMRVVRYITKDANDIEEFYKRAVFNVVAVNQDDHAKNTSFLMNYKGEWSLSPAYDITYANGKHYTKNHQMSIVGKVNNFEQEDLVQLGVNNGIKKERTIEIIENTITVVSSFSQRAKKIGIREDLVILVKHDIDNRMRSL
ncbi:type II toxin-antitoxin system HipA family toxin [Sulfurimonas sp.]|uniref:type II toxin-antitoxin system HipA family toxin n=1 Tax=Sulfurimonas sp. TaxID=2022749 RepID=UPI002AAF83C9|nr:type II toxin-antitoxin system HipA family toxin [Sulfurimonas sp.]